MQRHFSILVSLGTDVWARLPYAEHNDRDMKKHCENWKTELEKDFLDAGYGLDDDHENVPENRNGHFVRVSVSHSTSQGGSVSIEEWFETGTVNENDEFPVLNAVLTRKDNPDLWRIVDTWKSRIGG